jgi:DNA-binding GntR family transcriptional regulator
MWTSVTTLDGFTSRQFQPSETLHLNKPDLQALILTMRGAAADRRTDGFPAVRAGSTHRQSLHRKLWSNRWQASWASISRPIRRPLARTIPVDRYSAFCIQHATMATAMMKRLEPLSIAQVRLVDEATRAIREVILRGELSPGTQLRQADLAEQMNISRTPLREALMKLEQEGLLAVLPRRGFRVVELQLSDAIELYELREMLDGLAARLAATRAKEDVLKTLENLVRKMEKCVQDKNLRAWLDHHGAFHEEILKASGNTRLLGLIANIRLSIQGFHPLLLNTHDRLTDALREHEVIYRAIRAHDPDRAERVARNHIARARDLIIELSGRQSSPQVNSKELKPRQVPKSRVRNMR